MKKWMRKAGGAAAFVLAAASSLPLSVQAYESDVHYGLTKWLALKAGFTETEASAIALGNQRVDGGMMDTQALPLEYACTSRSEEIAKEVQQRHYPAVKAVPAPVADRVVEAGGPASRQQLQRIGERLKGKEGLMLLQFGEALHPLQDSWAHRGAPGVLSVPGVECDPMLVSVPATARNASPHALNLTHHSAQEVVPMARATYEVLMGYPAIQGRVRSAAAWNSLTSAIEEFAKLGTKSAKREWFVRHGIRDTAFLEGVSLPDGTSPGPLQWNGHSMPKLTRSVSVQHDVPADARAFVDELLARWLSAEPVDRLVESVGPIGRGSTADRKRVQRQLAARLKLWRWRDHGSVAALAHAPSPLNAAQLASVDRLTRDAAGSVQVSSPTEAVYPLQPVAPPAAPLVPYILRELSPSSGKGERMLAMLRLRHAPYDTLGWVIERQGERWVLADVVSVVNP